MQLGMQLPVLVLGFRWSTSFQTIGVCRGRPFLVGCRPRDKLPNQDLLNPRAGSFLPSAVVKGRGKVNKHEP